MNKYIYIDFADDYSKYNILRTNILMHSVIYSECPSNSRFKIIRFFDRIISNINLHLPFKHYWALLYVDKQAREILRTDNNVVFLFHGGFISKFGKKSLHLFNKRWPNAKTLYILTNPVATLLNSDPSINIMDLKQAFNYVLTYNREDSENYDLILSRPNIIPVDLKNSNHNCIWDVFFIGRDKGRLDKIISVYRECREAGLKCNFIIVGVPKEKQIMSQEINYSDYIPYSKILELIQQSRCVLNIMQSGASGITLRDKECIIYNKYLITDNDAIFDSPFYTPQKVINVHKLKGELSKITPENDRLEWNGVDEYSCYNYYAWIDNLINKL